MNTSAELSRDVEYVLKYYFEDFPFYLESGGSAERLYIHYSKNNCSRKTSLMWSDVWLKVKKAKYFVLLATQQISDPDLYTYYCKLMWNTRPRGEK